MNSKDMSDVVAVLCISSMIIIMCLWTILEIINRVIM